MEEGSKFSKIVQTEGRDLAPVADLVPAVVDARGLIDHGAGIHTDDDNRLPRAGAGIALVQVVVVVRTRVIVGIHTNVHAKIVLIAVHVVCPVDQTLADQMHGRYPIVATSVLR